MDTYKTLNKQSYSNGIYSLVPIRSDDRYAIMEWRNEQIYHLRQNKPLTTDDQDAYFETVIAQLFNKEQPDQILFSYLENGICIGYGGLVHINWIDKNAEISFVLNSSLEEAFFEMHWQCFLSMIELIAFTDLNFHKIYTYAFDLRPKLYNALNSSDFNEEARLKEHCYFNGNYLDVVIHSKIIFTNIFNLRLATSSDEKLIFDWANDNEVRVNSFNENPIKWENHVRWYQDKLANTSSTIFIFEKNRAPVGQIRLDLEDDYWVIDYSIDKSFRGKGLGKEILKSILKFKKFKKLKALVKVENIVSSNLFHNLGFKPNDKGQFIEFSITN